MDPNFTDSTVVTNVTKPLPELEPWLRRTLVISYLVTFVFGLAGNGLVIYIIAYYKSVRTKSVANYYIWNLSFADLFFILTLPFFCYGTYYQEWPFGWVACKIAYAIRETNRFASVFTLMALSVDRYIASFYSLSYLRTMRVGQITCVIVWLMCFRIIDTLLALCFRLHPAGQHNQLSLCLAGRGPDAQAPNVDLLPALHRPGRAFPDDLRLVRFAGSEDEDAVPEELPAGVRHPETEPEDDPDSHYCGAHLLHLPDALATWWSFMSLHKAQKGSVHEVRGTSLRPLESRSTRRSSH